MNHDRELIKAACRVDPDGEQQYLAADQKFKFFKHTVYVREPAYYAGRWTLFTPEDYYFSIPPRGTDSIDLKISVAVPLDCLAFICDAELYRIEVASQDIVITRDDLASIVITIKNCSNSAITIRPHSPIASMILFRASSLEQLHQASYEYQLH